MTRERAQHPAEVVAVLGGGANGAVFDRARVVVRGEDGLLRQADGWLSDGSADGPVLEEADLDALVIGREAVRLPAGVVAERDLWAWTFGHRFGPDRGEVEARVTADGGLVHRLATDGSLVLVVREQICGFRLAVLQRDAEEGALRALVRADGHEAVRFAERAYLTAREVTPLLVALLVRAHELAGNPEEGAGFRRMEASGQGEAFDRAVGWELDRLPTPRVDAGRRSPPWRAASAAMVARGLERAAA